MARITLAARVDALAATVEKLATVVAAQAAVPAGAPTVVVASSPIARHIGPSGKPDGREHPCTATPPCGRMLRSPKSAASHDPAQPHWHGAA